jgi:hypothetical protein
VQKLFHLRKAGFDALALELFQYQAQHNTVYKEYLNYLCVQPDKVKNIRQIPFLPIAFFKEHEIKTDDWETEIIFESSGTTGTTRSEHHVRSLDFYTDHSVSIFKHFYGDPHQFHFMALLPSYLERSNSSLVHMVSKLIENSGSALSGFYLDDFDQLLIDIEKAKMSDKRIFLIGVSFALLDLAEKPKLDLGTAIVMETGGMKGRRKEMIRDELHNTLKEGLKVEEIHSEYGMTELMSQAYAKQGGIFQTDKNMKVLLRDLNDPFDLQEKQRQGGINVIDLGNFNTCAFIETQDIGRFHNDGFEVLGRFDNSDIRGCNLLI